MIEEREEKIVNFIKEKEQTNWAVYIFDIMKALKLDKYDVIELIDECIANERIELRVLKNDQR